MTRLLSTMKNDVTVQVRNNLYSIGIGVGVLVAVVLSQLVNASQLFWVAPITVLLIAGGSTLLYVAGMIIFEKDEGTLHAMIVSPLRTSEYLWSKVLTLTTLSTIESLVIVGGAMLIISFSDELVLPNIPILVLGAVAMGVLYTLFGIVLIVRYDKITDFLVPVLIIVSILQIPFVHFWGVVEHPVFLLIPTSAPTMLMQGAFVSLEVWEWFYAIGYTAAMIIGLSVWAYRAFYTHIVRKVG